MLDTPQISEILREEFMEPLGLSARQLANDICVPVAHIQDLLQDRRKISADTSLRLGKYFGMSERYFLDLQSDIDIRNAKLHLAADLGKIEKIHPIYHKHTRQQAQKFALDKSAVSAV